MEAITHPEAYMEDRPLTVEHVYQEHAATIGRWIARLGGPNIDVEDTLHDVFLTIERKLSRFRGDAQLTTWLYAITLNQIRSSRRRERFHRLFRAPEHEANEAADTRLLPDEELERMRANKRLSVVLESLNERYRQVLVLFELESRSGQEVAQMMGTRVENVWVWLHRARVAFARELSRLEARELLP